MEKYFHIYQQILTSSGRPLPESAFGYEDLEELLQAGSNPGDNGTPERFFRQLSAMLQQSGSTINNRLRAELSDFLQPSLPPARNLASGFLALPSDDICECCYNMVIGYALDGYDRITGQHLLKAGGWMMRTWYRRQLSDIIRQLILLQPDFRGVPRPGIRVCYRVKAALCILMHRIYTRRDVPDNGRKPPIDVYALVQQLLQGGMLTQEEKESILTLFRSATGKHGPSACRADLPPARQHQPDAPFPGQPVRATPGPIASGIPVSSDIDLIKGLADDIHGQIGEIGTLIKTVKSRYSPREGEDDLTAMRRIGSKEAMKILGISSKKLQRLRESGQLPYLKITRTCSYLLSDVLKLLQPSPQNGGQAHVPTK